MAQESPNRGGDLFIVDRLSRTDRASASNRSRAVASAGSRPLSKSKCRSYSASLVPANCTGPHPY